MKGVQKKKVQEQQEFKFDLAKLFEGYNNLKQALKAKAKKEQILRNLNEQINNPNDALASPSQSMKRRERRGSKMFD